MVSHGIYHVYDREEDFSFMERINFSNLPLSSQLKQSLTDMGFVTASPIQSSALPFLLEGRDVIGQAQTGTGKTAAFGIPICEKVSAEIKQIQAVVMCPTRELAVQVTDEFTKLLKYKSGVKVLAIYGGQSIDRQLRALRSGVHILVATPGRLLDHINRGTINMTNVKMIVFDEADEMLDRGFREDIELVLNTIKQKPQVIFFSATMSKEIWALTKKYLDNPETIKVANTTQTAPKIEQIYFEIPQRQKPEVLTRLLDLNHHKLTLVFSNTKNGVNTLVEKLQSRGYLADGLHGDMRQNQRDLVMNKFRKGAIDILIATDVAARGIDVENVEIVVNYDMPGDTEYYIHRIGRTGRAGKAGTSYSFVTPREIQQIHDLRRYVKAEVVRKDPPSTTEAEESRLAQLLEKVTSFINEKNLGKYETMVEKLHSDDLPPLEVAAALLKIALRDDMQQEEVFESREESYDRGPRGGGRSRGGRAPRAGMVKLFLNVGRNQAIRPGDITGAIAGEANVPGKIIGAITIMDNFSFVEVPEQYAQAIIGKMKSKSIRGQRLVLEMANAAPDRKNH